MTYRHATNLKVPFDPVDSAFLKALSDYKIGRPVPAMAPEGADWKPLTFEQLLDRGFVGLYTTDEAISAPQARRKTGWGKIKLNGPEWTPET